MIHIKRFIERVSMIESKQGKDFVIPIAEARGMRDELAKILIEFHERDRQTAAIEPTFSVEIQGRSFR